MKLKVPHIFAVLFIAVIIAAIGTWLLPAGEYDREIGVEGRTVVVPGTYEHTTRTPQGIFDIFKSIPRGLADAAQVVFAVFIVGGAFGVFSASKAIDVGVYKLTRALKGKEIMAIPIIMIVFAIIASVIGNPELCLVYIPILIPLFNSLGFDLMTATGVTLAGVTSGFAVALVNPFSVGLAQKIAELPYGSGIMIRIIVWALFLLVSILYTMRYAKKVKANPKTSFALEETEQVQSTHKETEVPEVKPYHKWIGITIVIGLGIFIYGIFMFKWYMIELSAIFFGMMIITGLLSRMSLDEISNNFAEGCRKILVGALVVGFARAIALVLADGNIMDTIIYGLAQMVQGFPSQINAIGMLLAQTIINFVVPSSSGQAVVAMPIMIPLADIVGVTRQTAILAYQLGDGLSNILFPTSGYFMATLAMAGVPYQKWLRFLLPLMGIWIVVGSIALLITQSIGW